MTTVSEDLLDFDHLGHTLKKVREKKQVSTEQVAKATRIKESYLRAIDDEEYEILPRGPYEAAFIKSYADYLGLDGEKFAQVYKIKFHNVDASLPYQKILTQSRFNRSSLRAWLSLFLFLAILVTYGLVYYFQTGKESDSQTEDGTTEGSTSKNSQT